MPRTQTFKQGLPRWIADYHSLDFYGQGAPMDWTKFTDAKFGVAGKRLVPSGTVVHLQDGKITPGAPTTAGQPAYLLFADVAEDSAATSLNGKGLVTGGNVHEAWLPDSADTGSLPANLKTALTVRFHFQ